MHLEPRRVTKSNTPHCAMLGHSREWHLPTWRPDLNDITKPNAQYCAMLGYTLEWHLPIWRHDLNEVTKQYSHHTAPIPSKLYHFGFWLFWEVWRESAGKVLGLGREGESVDRMRGWCSCVARREEVNKVRHIKEYIYMRAHHIAG